MKLLRTLIIGFLTAALVMGIALPALAAGNTVNQYSSAYQMEQEKGPKVKVNKPKVDVDKVKENARGIVDKIKASIEKIRTEVVKGLVQGKSNDSLKIDGKEIFVDAQTKYHVPGVKNATLADIKEGMYVVAQTRKSDRKICARQIEVVPGKSTLRYEGKVTAFNYTPPVSGNVTAASDNATVAGNISIQQKSGEVLTFDILAGQFTVQPKGDTVQVGDLVTVIARHAPAGSNKLVATGVIIHHPVIQVSGNITAIDETNKTITVGTTVLKYSEKTVFELHGVLAVKVGQQATAWYREQVDNTRLAQRIRVK